MHGLKIVCDQGYPQEGEINIIAVPGIGGDQNRAWQPLSYETWGYIQLFRKFIGPIRVSTYTYPLLDGDSNILTRGGLSQEAKRLLEAVKGLKRTQRQRVAFIGHDIGGTLVKEAMLQAAFGDSVFRDIYHSTFMLLFLGCPHSSSHSANQGGSLTRLLAQNTDLASQPRNLFATCLDNVIQDINIDFVDLTLYHAAAVCNVFSNKENLGEKIFLEREAEVPLYHTAPHFQESRSLSHSELALDVSEDARIFIERHTNSLRREVSVMGDSGSSLSYVSRLQIEDHPFPHEIDAALKTAIQNWASVRKTTMLIVQNVDNFRSAKWNASSCILKSPVASATVLLNHFFDFDQSDSRASTVDAMMAAFVTQAAWELKDSDLSACNSTLSNQRFGWNKVDWFNLYHRTFLTRSDIEISWTLANLDRNIESYPWLLDTLRRVATNCDFRFRVVFLNRNSQDFAMEPECATVINWANPRTPVQAATDQQPTDSINGQNEIQNTDFQVSPEFADLSAVRIIEQKNRSSFLGPKLVELFQKGEVSYDYKRLIEIWASNYHSPNVAEAINSHLSATIEIDLERTFQVILDAAIPGPWGSESAIETLELIVFSLRSLTYNELGDLEDAYKEWEPNRKGRPTGYTSILSWLPGILDIHGREICLSHPSFRQFLQKQNAKKLCLSDKGLEKTQNRLALLCLEYLLSSHGRGLLESAVAKGGDIGAPDPRICFASYAIGYWPKHAQLAGVHFSLEADLVNAMLEDQAMLDTWAKAYWKYSSKPFYRDLNELGSLAIFAQHGLDNLLTTLIERYQGTNWLADQFANAIAAAARNGMISSACLLSEQQSFGSGTIALRIQVSLQSEDRNCLLFATSKALQMTDPWACFSATVCQCLATCHHDVSITMLSHAPWQNLEDTKKKAILMAAAEGGNIESLGYILDNCDSLIGEEDISRATVEATRIGHATTSAWLLTKLLAKVSIRKDLEHEPQDGVLESSELPVQKLENQSTVQKPNLVDAETRSEILNSEHRPQEGSASIEEQATPAGVSIEDTSETSVKQTPSGSMYGETFLELAIQKGQLGIIPVIVDVLLQQNARISSAQTLLKNAISHRRPRCFNALLVAFSHANARIPDFAVLEKKEILIHALKWGSVSFVQGLLSNGVQLDETTFHHVFDNAVLDDDTRSLMESTVMDEARKSIKESVLVEVLTTRMVTALEEIEYKVAKRLIQAGANVNTREICGTRTPLYHAAYRGAVDIVELLLKAEADVNIAEDDDDGWLPIHAAYDNVDILRLLLTSGADVNATTSGGDTVLYLASKWNHYKCVEEILKHKPNLDYPIRDTTILAKAVDGGYESVISMLLDAGTNPLHPTTADRNRFVLHNCVKKNFVDILRKLLLFNFDLEQKDTYGRTALNCGSAAKHIPALRLLIRRGARIETRDEPWNDTPLSNAVLGNDVELAKFLISEGASVSTNIGRRLENTPLLLACQRSSLEMVKMLIENGASISDVSVGRNGTVFQASCRNSAGNQAELLSYLLENELVDLHQTSDFWGGNLNTACLMTDINVVDLLIRRGADVSLRDKIGRWPVQFALYRTIEHVKCLCDRGPDQTSAQRLVKDSMQRNALHFAVVSGRLELVKYVIDKQSGLSKEKDCDGWTPLFWAVRVCHIWATQTSERAQIIQELLNDGADITVMAEGIDRLWSPYTLARYHGLGADIIALLQPTQDQINNSQHRTIWERSIAARFKEAKYHTGEYCDICLLGAVGICYICTDCPYFSLCFKCYRSRDLVHDRHSFIARHEEDEYIYNPHAPPSPTVSSVPGSSVTYYEPVPRLSATSVSSISTDEDIDAGEDDDGSSLSEDMDNMDD